VTGIILAGGKNKRMGVNKAFLNICGKRIIDNTLSIYRRIFSEIIIVTNNPEDYSYSGVKLIKDIIPGKGSLGGLYTGLVEAKNQYCFVSACDMPFINENLIVYIMSFNGYDIVVPWVEGNYEPLFALYSRDCLRIIERQFDEQNYKISDLFSKVKIKKISVEELKLFDYELRSLININTPKDYKKHLLQVK